jgi:carbonic anhydrase
MKLKVMFYVLIGIIISMGCVKKQKENESLSVIERLLKGNENFQHFAPSHPDQDRKRLLEVAKGQHPMAIVITCSDSRVSPELIFDQGIGDLFVIRTAGHAVSDYELASIEYAVEHLNVKDIVVLGHESCGAIKTFIEHPKDSLPKHINHLIDYFRHEKEEELPLKHHCLNEAIFANVNHTVKIIRDNFDSEHLNIYGMFYKLESGKVEFVKQ